jgi:riboflavin biosynthesis pyrimidine reductase
VDAEEAWARLTAGRALLADVPPDGAPAVAVNMVTSVDGATTIGGRVGGLTATVDQALLYRLRREADAVLVGAGTVRAEGYGRLLPDEDRRRRADERGDEEPLLVVVTHGPGLPEGAPALGEAPGPLVFLTPAEGALPPAARPVRAIRAGETPRFGEAVRLGPLLRRLAEEYGVRRVVCEGGPTLNGSLFAEGLVQELFVSVSPQLAQEPPSPRLLAGAAPPVALELVAHATAGGFVFLRYRVPG